MQHISTPSTPEEWRPVVGYEGIYEVSDRGRVRSMDRLDAIGRPRKGKLRHPSSSLGGYQGINLSKGKKISRKLVHRMVLEAFVGPCPEGMEACHSNAVRHDNRLANLRWGTRSENELDKVIMGTHTEAIKTQCPRGHALVAPNIRAAHAQRGHRTCKACDRARSYVYQRPERELKFDAIADLYFEEIMRISPQSP